MRRRRGTRSCRARIFARSSADSRQTRALESRRHQAGGEVLRIDRVGQMVGDDPLRYPRTAGRAMGGGHERPLLVWHRVLQTPGPDFEYVKRVPASRYQWCIDASAAGVEVRDRAGVLEGADAFDALLAADARLLHAAERRAQVEAGGAVVVDPDVAADQLAADAVGRLRGPPSRPSRTGPPRCRSPSVTASSSVSNGITGMTGPNCSSVTTRSVRVGVRRRSRGARSCRPPGRRPAARRTRSTLAPESFASLMMLVDERLLAPASAAGPSSCPCRGRSRA